MPASDGMPSEAPDPTAVQNPEPSEPFETLNPTRLADTLPPPPSGDPNGVGDGDNGGDRTGNPNLVAIATTGTLAAIFLLASAVWWITRCKQNQRGGYA